MRTTVRGWTSGRRTGGRAGLGLVQVIPEPASATGARTVVFLPPVMGCALGRTPISSPGAVSMSNRNIQPSAADLVTAGNALCGFLSIVVVATAARDQTAGGGLPDSPLVLAAVLIIVGAALDSVDGIVARRFGGSPLGEHLEVMGDVLTFGLAPAVLFAVHGAGHTAPWDTLAVVAGAAYLTAALMRLARYAVLTGGDGSDHRLTGLPTPPAAMGMLGIIGIGAPAPVGVGLVLLMAVLMTRTFPFPVLTGFAGRVIGTWFVVGTIAIFTLPYWVPAAGTLLILAGAFVLVGRRRLA